MTGAPDTPSPAAILYPSATKPEPGTTATPGTTSPKPSTGATKPAATSPASASPGTAAQPGKGAWQAPSAAPQGTAAPDAPGTTAQPAKAAQPYPPRDPSDAPNAAAVLYDSPLAANELADVMKLPDDLDAAGFAETPEAKAERQAFRDALAGEGVNRAEAEFIAQFTIASAAPSYVAPDYGAAEHELRALWPGAEFDTNMRAARAAVQRIAAKVPGVKRHLRDTGADNDPKLIRALSRMGRKRGLA